MIEEQHGILLGNKPLTSLWPNCSDFDGRSDYHAFQQIGIPTLGLHTKAGAPWDNCYHLPCDRLDNIDWDALYTCTYGAHRVAESFADDLSLVDYVYHSVDPDDSEDPDDDKPQRYDGYKLC